MADSTVGMLPRASQIDDESLLLMEQQGTAMSATGKMIKDYAKAGLEANFKEDVDAANDAADRAKEAAAAVVDMTVEAHASDEATVKKSMKDGKVNLEFGLPRGEQGIPGKQGEIGPPGPQGKPGTGLKVLGYYDSEEALRAAVKSPEAGDAYGVGTEPPYDIYVFDGVTNDWINNGPFSGGGGGVLPDNVVTADGGGEMEVEGNIGKGPYKFIFTDEEEPPLTAEDIEYNGGTVQEALEGLFTSVADGKKAIASAVSDKGVPTEKDATFQQMADNIRDIKTGGGDYSDATATPGDILAGKTAYVKGGKVEGTIPSLQARTIMPGTQEQTITAGNYLAGTQVIRGDQNLQPVNIRKGVTLFNVAGAMESTFQATLTVTVDAGAVVTATHSGGTKVESLCITGKVALELPLEGQWTVTAQRGVSQYNSVVITVSSGYTATLTAEIHIVRFGNADALSISRSGAAGASIGNKAIFAGGNYINSSSSSQIVANVDAYDEYLIHSTLAELSSTRSTFIGAHNNNFAFFASKTAKIVDAYSSALEKTTCEELTATSGPVFGGNVGDYAVFVGSNFVEAYNGSKTHTTTTPPVTTGTPVGASNANYVVFYSNGKVMGYDSYLSRSIASDPPAEAIAAVNAGNYVLFFNKDNMYAYDLFLTQVKAEEPSARRTYISTGTLKGYGFFYGGYVSYSSSNQITTLSTAIDVYDPYLTKISIDQLTRGIYLNGVASAGNYLLFAGGTYATKSTTGWGYVLSTSSVDVYQYL